MGTTAVVVGLGVTHTIVAVAGYLVSHRTQINAAASNLAAAAAQLAGIAAELRAVVTQPK